MRFLPTALGMVLYAAAIAAEDNSNYNASLNYRPGNVSASLNDLYLWVGSYYNATAQVDFIPYGGVAASITSQCPAAFSNQTGTRNYTARLGLTEPSLYNSANDPVNAFLTLWPLDFNFSTLLSGQIIIFMPGLEYALFSSTPLYGTDDPSNNWIWSLENTTSPPYTLSSTISSGYVGWNGFTVRTATSCAGSSEWSFVMDKGYFNGTNLPSPNIDLQFDGSTANLTLQGYAEADPIYETGSTSTTGDTTIAGEFRLTFSGVIDTYHSDILRNDTSTPGWLRTVGFNNNSANFGYTTSESTRSKLMGPLSLTAIVSAVWLMIL
ncbi:hypothetical protein BGW36DRAFT_423084 [Talaromyces proteolyticus]|uniref:Uncharacterized protein n=1 Tax=Talaromyces proteolyticus TaxID=1131652 RepID=A0AAD4KZL0_9EURO|nr:uncharacterized protein BGW36DRAFT_423084 [Talaromyces proteolyticus]KAH8703523.1 hypothetical protein BGW36DRAFT_423084 [Talaromyces proteolyticus]